MERGKSNFLQWCEVWDQIFPVFPHLPPRVDTQLPARDIWHLVCDLWQSSFVPPFSDSFIHSVFSFIRTIHFCNKSRSSSHTAAPPPAYSVWLPTCVMTTTILTYTNCGIMTSVLRFAHRGLLANSGLLSNWCRMYICMDISPQILFAAEKYPGHNLHILRLYSYIKRQSHDIGIALFFTGHLFRSVHFMRLILGFIF